MRDVHNDTPAPGSSCPPVPRPPAEDRTRRCVLTGTEGSRDQLIRLVPGPDGLAWPDLAARLPGRGAWISVGQPALEVAIANGRLQAALQRAFKGKIRVPQDLAQRIAAGLERRALERLGLEQRGGHLIFGSAKLAEWATAGRLQLLLHAADARPDGCARLDQAWRVGGGDASGILRLPAGRESLSQALGRANVVHAGVIQGKAAARIRTGLKRWIAFIGKDDFTDVGLQTAGRRNDEGRE